MKQNCAFKISYNTTQQKMYVEWEKNVVENIPKIILKDDISNEELEGKPRLLDKSTININP